MNKSIKVDLIVSNSINEIVHFTVSFQAYYVPINFISLQASYNLLYHPNLAFVIFFYILVQPDFFALKQNFSLPPFLKLILIWLPSCFSDNAKASHEFFKTISFNSLDTIFSHMFTTPKCHMLKIAVFITGSKTVRLNFT